ncbi:MAG: SIS domain-containing protein [Bacteroidales bacterium]|nr:SIS domain-containing protein [Bacteroidales bacterium]
MSFNYHTYREIKQQPAVWRVAYDLVLARKSEIKSFIDKYTAQGYEIVLTGAGTSAYIGDALEPALFDTAFRGARAIATTDILTAPEFYFNQDSRVLLISFARSGNSPESVGAVRVVEQTAGKVAHIFITCNPDGQLARMKGDHILTILLPPETNDVSLAMTSSYSTMLLSCSLIANIGKIEEQGAWIDAISAAAAAAMEEYEPAIQEIASRKFTRAVFLGSGPLKGVAEESRLKLQELTDGAIMCAFDSFLGFRHGPKAVVKSDSLMVYLVSPKEKIQRYERDLIRQVTANNRVAASVIVCMSKPDVAPENYDLCVDLNFPEEVPACYGCVTYVVVAQLLGFFKSLDCGLNPDSPSISGNISRVVEGVTLYI